MQLLISRKAAIMHAWIFFSLIRFVSYREEVRRAAYAGMVSLNPPNHIWVNDIQLLRPFSWLVCLL